MIRERLEAGQPIPANAKRQAVEGVMQDLLVELTHKLMKPYVWLAITTSAIEAGQWGGNRRLNRRLKLAKMIGECATFLGVEHPLAHFKKGWERTGLAYGYGIVEQLSQQTGLSPLTLTMSSRRIFGAAARA